MRWKATRSPGRVYAGRTSQDQPVVARLDAKRKRVTDLLVSWDSSSCQPEGFVHYRRGACRTSGSRRRAASATRGMTRSRLADGSAARITYAVAGRVARRGAARGTLRIGVDVDRRRRRHHAVLRQRRRQLEGDDRMTPRARRTAAAALLVALCLPSAACCGAAGDRRGGRGRRPGARRRVAAVLRRPPHGPELDSLTVVLTSPAEVARRCGHGGGRLLQRSAAPGGHPRRGGPGRLLRRRHRAPRVRPSPRGAVRQRAVRRLAGHQALVHPRAHLRTAARGRALRRAVRTLRAVTRRGLRRGLPRRRRRQRAPVDRRPRAVSRPRGAARDPGRRAASVARRPRSAASQGA